MKFKDNISAIKKLHLNATNKGYSIYPYLFIPIAIVNVIMISLIFVFNIYFILIVDTILSIVVTLISYLSRLKNISYKIAANDEFGILSILQTLKSKQYKRFKYELIPTIFANKRNKILIHGVISLRSGLILIGEPGTSITLLEKQLKQLSLRISKVINPKAIKTIIVSSSYGVKPEKLISIILKHRFKITSNEKIAVISILNKMDISKMHNKGYIPDNLMNQ